MKSCLFMQAAYVPVIDILVGKAVIHNITKIAQRVVFDLTCGIISDPEVNETRFPATKLPGLFNAFEICK